MTVQEIFLELNGRRYPHLVGAGVSTRVGEFLPSSAKRVAVVTQEGLPSLASGAISLDTSTFTIARGEDHKNLATVETLCTQFSSFGLTRGDVIVSVGGGLVSDVAGFAAATYHRGVSVIHVPTTLLAQVDAAIGGKTGVNLSTGKNLAGAFWQPTAVLCDINLLRTLPERELKSGYGEMAKYHFLGTDLLKFQDDLVSAIASSVELKLRFVQADEREERRSASGGRALLNYGHTLAHALESIGGFGLRHGEAVAVGLKYAALVALRLDRIDAAKVAEHDAILTAYGLSAKLPSGLSHEDIVSAMRRDKKSFGTLTMILDSDRGVELVEDVPEEAARAALNAMEVSE